MTPEHLITEAERILSEDGGGVVVVSAEVVKAEVRKWDEALKAGATEADRKHAADLRALARADIEQYAAKRREAGFDD